MLWPTIVFLTTCLILNWLSNEAEEEASDAEYDDDDWTDLFTPPMIIDDSSDSKVFLNEDELFKKTIISIKRVWNDDYDLDETVISYADKTEHKLFLSDSGHDDLVEKAEEFRENWKL